MRLNVLLLLAAFLTACTTTTAPFSCPLPDDRRQPRVMRQVAARWSSDSTCAVWNDSAK